MTTLHDIATLTLHKYYGDYFFPEDDSGFTGEFLVPGFPVETLSVKARENTISVSATPNESMAAKNRIGFEVTYSFADYADVSKVKAELNLGVLTVFIPKKKDSGYSKVAIKT